MDKKKKIFELDETDELKLIAVSNDLGMSQVDCVRLAIRDMYDRVVEQKIRPTLNVPEAS